MFFIFTQVLMQYSTANIVILLRMLKQGKIISQLIVIVKYLKGNTIFHFLCLPRVAGDNY